jgi:outer membrane immunogenic protein
MRRILLASAALLACAAVDSATAADLPPAPPPPAVAPVKAPLPVWSWSGCYVGVNGGGTRGQNSADLSPAGSYLNAPGALPPPNPAGTGDLGAELAPLSHSYDMATNGWEAGGQVGCNAQWGMAVLGIEGDWQWTNTSTSADGSFPGFFTPGTPVPNSFTTPSHTEHVDVTQHWFATARVRAGFTPWERVLIYATGGVAWANYQSNTAVAFATSPAFLAPYDGAVHTGSASTNQLGWVAGGGIEWALTNNWSVKAEYLYLRFDGFNYSSPLTAAAPSATPFAPGYAWNTSVSLREQVARVGVNYKFDWGPVVARY